MKTINYYLQGFGFSNMNEYITSTFGYIATKKAISWSIFFGLLNTYLQRYLGFDLLVFSAFIVLNFLEFRTGIKASKKKGEKVESRKMGRMFLKVGTYLLIIWMLHSFEKGLQFPTIADLEIDPFVVFYWAFIAGIIYQLFKSLLENLVALGYEEADGVLGFLIRKYNKYFESNSTK